MKGILEKLCIEALENYYKYGTTDFVDAFEENIVFFTPYENKMIVGKNEVINYFTQGGKKLEINIENLITKLIPLKADAMVIVADYSLLACYPDSRVISFKQHTLVALHRRKQADSSYRWMCPLIHISNSRQKNSLNQQSPIAIVQYEQDIIRSLFKDRITVKKIMLSGESNSTYYIPEDSINYIEGGKGVQCYVHTDSEVITAKYLMKDIIAKLPSYYYRCHSSYIVNLRRVKSVCAYKVTLEDGEEIPIPAKKYSQVKDDITSFMTESKI